MVSIRTNLAAAAKVLHQGPSVRLQRWSLVLSILLQGAVVFRWLHPGPRKNRASPVGSLLQWYFSLFYLLMLRFRGLLSSTNLKRSNSDGKHYKCFWGFSKVITRSNFFVLLCVAVPWCVLVPCFHWRGLQTSHWRDGTFWPVVRRRKCGTLMFSCTTPMLFTLLYDLLEHDYDFFCF